ncbi:MAG: type IV secretion system DNA-binding domain-containing protein [Actinomycetia bacterium]|nr:type IV secretion system DNA-binding domain-containing protein [Actinomycetes bacterium]
MRWLAWLKHPVVEGAAVLAAVCAGGVGAVSGWSSGRLFVPDTAWATAGLWLTAATWLAGRRRGWTLAGWGLWAAGWLPLALFLVGTWIAAGPPLGNGDGPPLGWPLGGLPLRWAEGDRLLHAHVLGPTGSGKSRRVLLPWMVHDLERGRPFTLIEPKGDLAALVRVRAHRVGGRLVVFDPLDPDCPHLNPLAGDAAAAGASLALALDQLDPATHPFYRTVGQVLLVQVVRALKTARPDTADLAAVLEALRDPRRLEAALRGADDDSVAYFRAEWGALAPTRRQELQLGLVHRLRALLLHPAVARVLAPPFDFDWEEVLRDGWCVLAPLNGGALGAGARALGTLLWHLLVQAAYRRGPAARLVHTVYLDEFHQYVAPDLADVLAMVRGYGISVVLAHQDLGQLTPPLAEAVLANARTRVVLAGSSAADVARLAAEAMPHRYPSPRYLPPGWAVVTRTVRGRLERPRVVRLPVVRADKP